MSVPLAVEGMDALALAQEGERLCRENNMKSGWLIAIYLNFFYYHSKRRNWISPINFLTPINFNFLK